MRQSIGFLLIFILFPVIWLLYSFIQTELLEAEVFKETIQDSIQLSSPSFSSPVILVDRHEQIFSEDYVEWRQPLELEEIPPFVNEIFIQSEDEKFYNHIGFNFSAIVRALVANATAHEKEQGASTITQQLVRLHYLSTEKTYERKLTELFYAYEMEKEYSKDEILTNYLNEMYFGNQVYGIGAAATYYFNRPLAELNEAEIAFICAIPNNPALYNPLEHFKDTKKRQERLIDVLVRNEVITKAHGEKIKKEDITLLIKQKKQSYPAYSTYVYEELKQLIASQEGYVERMQQETDQNALILLQNELQSKINEVLSEGITVYTALDPSKQEKDEAAINQLLAKSNNGIQAATVIIDNNTREIVSVYGGYKYKKFDFHRAYQAVRQPGSSLKPLLVYGPLFETTTYTPNNLVDGGKLCIGNYCPQNYGGRWYGQVTIRDAFKLSHNTPAVRLLEKVGVNEAFSKLDSFQFQHVTEQDFTLSAALGGLTRGVTVLEMADAYSSFIDGIYTPTYAIRQVKDKEGNTLYEWNNDKKEIWSFKTVQTMRELLALVVKEGTGRGITVHTPYVGAKTGTTNDFRDFWVAGLTNQYTSAVWVGYDQPQNMKRIENKKIPHQIFNLIMQD